MRRDVETELHCPSPQQLFQGWQVAMAAVSWRTGKWQESAVGHEDGDHHPVESRTGRTVRVALKESLATDLIFRGYIWWWRSKRLKEMGVCTDRAQSRLPHERRPHKVQLWRYEPAHRTAMDGETGDRELYTHLSGISSGLSKSSKPRLDRKSGMVS